MLCESEPLRYALLPGNIAYMGDAKPRLDSFADRVWYAWHCLPRGKKGEPPSFRYLETQHGLSLATFSKIKSGEKDEVETATLLKLAEILSVTTDWLLRGVGDAPRLTGVFHPRGNLYAASDPSEWVRHHEANPAAIVPGQRSYANPFEEAAADFKDKGVVALRVVALEREKARGKEWERNVIAWWKHLVAAVNQDVAEKGRRAEKRRKPPIPKRRAS